MEDTRAALIRAGLAEFAERGLDQPSLDAICARAGFTRGAFYVHFKNRDAFLVAVMESVLGEFLDSILADDTPGDDLEQTIARFAGMLTAGNSVTGAPGSMRTHHLLDVCARSEEMRERFLALLAGAEARVAATAAAGQQAGRVREDLDAASIATVLVVMATGVVQLYELGLPLSVAKIRNAVLAMVRP